MNDKQAEDKRYIIPLAKELFEPKHRKLISNPLGLFAWLVDKTTKEVIANNGEMEGLVLGGAPITYTDIAKVFGRPERTVRRWKALLEDWKYIRTERTNHQGSLRWTVRKSKKFKKTPTEQRPLMDTAAPEQRPHLSSPTATFVQSNGHICPTQLEIQRDAGSIQTPPTQGGEFSNEAGREAVATTGGEQRPNVAAANAPAMLKLFMDTFGLALPPNPTWLSKLKAVIARRGVEVVTKALHNATYSERWIKFMQNADDAMQVFVKDSNIDNLIDLKLKKDKPKPKAINLPGRKTDNLDHIKVNTI